MELKQYAVLLRRWWWLVVLCAALAGAGAFGVSWLQSPVYEASTALMIIQAPAGSASPDYNSLLTSERLAKTYAELLRKRPVLEEVIYNLNLGMDAADLASQIKVTAIRDTQLIVVTVEDLDPQRAADISNEIVKVFIRQNRDMQVSRYSDSMQNLQQELEKIQADIDRTQVSLDALKTPTTPDQIAERNQLEALLAQYRASYATLLESFEQVRLAEAQTSDNVSIVEEARPEFTPVRPRTALNTALTAVVGGVLAVGIAFLVESLDDSVKTTEDVEAITRSSVLGAIARIEGDVPTEKLVVASKPRSQIAEAYRVLRANIELSAVDAPVRTIVVTSSSPVEGKSTTIANLAVSIAQSGKRVILVDTDLRRPTLHKLFGLSNVGGLTTALLDRNGSTGGDYAQPTGVRNLRLIPSGPLPPNPAELLGSQRMLEVIGQLRAEADIVLFDSPPILAVADATLLANLCDATLLVVLSSSTRADALRRAREQLAQAGARLLGVVLNRISTSHGSYYYYYHYSYQSRDAADESGYHTSPAQTPQRHAHRERVKRSTRHKRHHQGGRPPNLLTLAEKCMHAQLEISFREGSFSVDLVSRNGHSGH